MFRSASIDEATRGVRDQEEDGVWLDDRGRSEQLAAQRTFVVRPRVASAADGPEREGEQRQRRARGRQARRAGEAFADEDKSDDGGWNAACNVTARGLLPEKGPAMIRKASAQWKGSLKDGKGTVSTASGVLDATQYSFATRFEDGKGTNPEELIAAAHAGCFSMALSGQLGAAGMTADRIDTKATLKMEKLEQGFTVTSIHLDVTAAIPGGDAEAFAKAAKNAKENCPISRLLDTKDHDGREAGELKAFAWALIAGPGDGSSAQASEVGDALPALLTGGECARGRGPRAARRGARSSRRPEADADVAAVAERLAATRAAATEARLGDARDDPSGAARDLEVAAPAERRRALVHQRGAPACRSPPRLLDGGVTAMRGELHESLRLRRQGALAPDGALRALGVNRVEAQASVRRTSSPSRAR